MPTHLEERKDDTQWLMLTARLSAHKHTKRTACVVPRPDDPSDGYEADSFTRPRIVRCDSHKELFDLYEEYKERALARHAGACLICYEVTEFKSANHANLNDGSKAFRTEGLPVDSYTPHITAVEYKAHPGKIAYHDPETNSVEWK